MLQYKNWTKRLICVHAKYFLLRLKTTNYLLFMVILLKLDMQHNKHFAYTLCAVHELDKVISLSISTAYLG